MKVSLVLRHIASGKAECKRAKEGLVQVARNTGTGGVIAGWRKPTPVNARDARQNCGAIANARARQAARENSHTKDSMDIYQAIKKTHGTDILPRRALCGDHLGQLMHQQIRAAATRLNAYTGRHNRKCTHAQYPNAKDTNRHAVVECNRYTTARHQFTLETGVSITPANYVDIMALKAGGEYSRA